MNFFGININTKLFRNLFGLNRKCNQNNINIQYNNTYGSSRRAVHTAQNTVNNNTTNIVNNTTNETTIYDKKGKTPNYDTVGRNINKKV